MNGLKQWPLRPPIDSNHGKQSAIHSPFYFNKTLGDLAGTDHTEWLKEASAPVIRHEVRAVGETSKVVSINRLTGEEKVWP